MRLGTNDDFLMPPGTYLQSHSVGCPLRSVRNTIDEAFLSPWTKGSNSAWPRWLDEVDRFRDAVAGLIGARPDDVCPQSNVSSGLSKILGALPDRRGRRKILLCEEDFPSLGFVIEMARTRGYEIEFIPRGDAAQDLDEWSRRLGDDVQFALITHAFSNRSARLPVAEIADTARARGVFTAVDAVQSAGVIPIDVAAWSADFVLGSSVKFLCGGPGAGFMWARPETAAQCAPVDTGWFSHEDPFAFDIHDYRPREGALRFWGGTPSVLPFAIAARSIRHLTKLGVEEIHAHNQGLIDRLHGHLPSDAIASVRERDRRGNAVLVRLSDPDQAASRLSAGGFHCDIREGAVRVSPHLYNTADEIDRFAEAVASFL